MTRFSPVGGKSVGQDSAVRRRESRSSKMSQKRQPEEKEASRGGPAESDGSSSPPHCRAEAKRQKVPALREVIMEVIRKTTIEKMFKAIEPLIRRVVKEEIELAFANHFTMVTSGKDIVLSTSKNLQLQFMTKLSLPIFTGSKIEGESSSSITIALLDALTKEVVAPGNEHVIKVEIVVLEGDFESGEDNNWTAEEFNSNIVREREGKRSLLSGDLLVELTEGIGTVGELSFTDNSSWTRSRKFRLGARTVDGCFNGIRVREAKTESFVVKDHRGELYKKHHPPLLEDEVWRLEKIGKDGAFHKRLNSKNINTVKDFLTLLNLDAPRLRNILGGGMSTKMWEATVEHAKTCLITDKMHVYWPDCLSKTGVVFNVVGEVKGLISEQKFVPIDDVVEKEKADAHAVVKQAYEHRNDIFTCDKETLVEDCQQLLNQRSPPSLHVNEYSQSPTQVTTEGFDLSHSNIPSPGIFSIDASRTLDACAQEIAECNENRFQPGMHPPGGFEPSEESLALGKFSNSLVYEECCSQPSFSEDYYPCRDPSISFDTQDLGAALKGFIATISKPRYRGWRTLSCVLWLIFYTKKIVARKRKKPGK